jgi:hypothetical protein
MNTQPRESRCDTPARPPHAPATDSVRISKGVHGAPCEASACRLAPLGVVSLASHQCGHCGADLPNIPRGNGCVMSRDGVKGYQTFYFRAGATLCNLSVDRDLR